MEKQNVLKKMLSLITYKKTNRPQTFVLPESDESENIGQDKSQTNPGDRNSDQESNEKDDNQQESQSGEKKRKKYEERASRNLSKKVNQ